MPNLITISSFIKNKFSILNVCVTIDKDNFYSEVKNMKIKKMLGNKYALIIEKDEMIIEMLTEFANSEKIGMAQFQMIGSITDVTLGYVPPKSSEYLWKTFKDQWELLSGAGTISWDKENMTPIVHCHVSIGDHNFKVIGGHMRDAKVAIKAEVIVDVLNDKQIYQVIDNKSNFHAWDI